MADCHYCYRDLNLASPGTLIQRGAWVTFSGYAKMPGVAKAYCHKGCLQGELQGSEERKVTLPKGNCEVCNEPLGAEERDVRYYAIGWFPVKGGTKGLGLSEALGFAHDGCIGKQRVSQDSLFDL